MGGPSAHGCEIRAVTTSGDQGARADDLAAYERRFRRAGLPLFIEGFSASTDVFNRAVPLLALVFCGEMLGAIQLDWSLAANVAAALGGLAILLVAIGIVEPLPRAGPSGRSRAPSAARARDSSCSSRRCCR